MSLPIQRLAVGPQPALELRPPPAAARLEICVAPSRPRDLRDHPAQGPDRTATVIERKAARSLAFSAWLEDGGGDATIVIADFRPNPNISFPVDD